MLKKDSLYLILHYFLDHSYDIGVKWGALCLKPTDFKKQYFIQEDYQTGKKTTETSYDFSRKNFEKYRERLLEEKLITRIKFSDKRTTYYSITPLGICRLMQSPFHDPDKIRQKDLKKILPILETFAKKYVNPYKSEIFDKGSIDFKGFYNTLLSDIDLHDIGEEMPYLIEEITFDSDDKRCEFSLELLFKDQIPAKITLATFENIEDSEIILSEMGQRSYHNNYKPIKLSEEQLHQYTSRLLLSLVVYFHYQMRHSEKLVDYNNLPEYILQILLAFNRCIVKITNDQAKNMESFAQLVNQIKK